jgi:hypothetical protein
MIKRKQLGKDDPLSQVGIITSNHVLPYKKPILKQAPAFNVNTRGVLEELYRDYGGLRVNNNAKSHMMLMAGVTPT